MIFNRRNILLLCGAVLIAFAFWYFRDLQILYGRIEDLFAVVARYNQFLAVFVFMLFSIVSAMVSFFTSTPLIPAASHLWGSNITFILLAGSWIIGGMLAYAIGHYAHTFLKNLSVYKKTEQYLNHLDSNSSFILVLLFRLATPSEVGGYTLGILRYKFWKYMLITVFSEAPFAVLALYSTDALVSRQPILFIFEIAGGIVFIGAMLYFFHYLLRKKSSA